jgi:hypothetical protein
MQDKHWVPWILPICLVLFFGRFVWEIPIVLYVISAGLAAWLICLAMLFWPKRKRK